MGNDLQQIVEESQSEALRTPETMRLGAPTLRIRDLDGTLAFYQNNLGFKVKRRYRDPSDDLEVIELGFNSDEAILVLKHDPNASRTPHNFAGLYHYAVLVPDRKSLASTYLAVADSGTRYDGFADHGFSEALYLHDKETNGIEVYADRPKARWPDWNRLKAAIDAGNPDALSVMSRPLDFESLLRELGDDQTHSPSWFSRGAKIGHMHLRVTNLERSVRFYSEELGFDTKAYIPQIGAAFLSVDGYHHHIGLNTWHSLRGSVHKSGEAGLENFRIAIQDKFLLRKLVSRFPNSSEKDSQLSVSDPDGIQILLGLEE